MCVRVCMCICLGTLPRCVDRFLLKISMNAPKAPVGGRNILILNFSAFQIFLDENYHEYL